MKLLIVRHADAGDAEEFAKTGQADYLRPLSKKGHKQMSAGVRGLLELVPSCDLIVSSPFTRAAETAEHLRVAYEREAIETTPALEPTADPAHFELWMREHAEAELGGTVDVAIAVGHEPHLSELTTWLISGRDGSSVEMKKGGACLLAFDGPVRKASAVLRWLMGPSHLAAVGRDA
jgi:phosphohistidine phosphatase